MGCSRRGKAVPGQRDGDSFPAVPRCVVGAQASFKKMSPFGSHWKLIIFMLMAEPESWFPLHQDFCDQT